MTLSKIRDRGRVGLLVYLFLMSGPVLEKVFSDGPAVKSASAGSGSIFVLLIFSLVLIGLTLTVLARAARPVLNLLLAERWLFLLFLLSWVSTAWSADPLFTLHEIFYATLYLICAAYLAVHFTISRLINYLRTLSLMFALASIPAQFLLKAVRDPREVPGWEGVFTHKNMLGIAMVLGLASILVQRKRLGLGRLLQCGLHVALLMLSQSTTSMVCAATLVFSLIALRMRSKARAIYVLFSTSLAMGGYYAISRSSGQFLGTAGKDATLTGRTEIWAFVIHGVAQRPWLGWGYSAFWNFYDLAAVQRLGWNPGQAHNAYLQVLVDLGVIGLVLALLEIGSLFARGAILMKYGQTESGLWMLVLACIVVVHGVSEANFLLRSYLWTVVLLSSLCARSTMRTIGARRVLPQRGLRPVRTTLPEGVTT